jgi:hypothetical protein
MTQAGLFTLFTDDNLKLAQPRFLLHFSLNEEPQARNIFSPIRLYCRGYLNIKFLIKISKLSQTGNYLMC